MERNADEMRDKYFASDKRATEWNFGAIVIVFYCCKLLELPSYSL